MITGPACSFGKPSSGPADSTTSNETSPSRRTFSRAGFDASCEQGILVAAPYGDWPVRHEYRLTERGLDLYQLPLAMLTWGQRWLDTNESDIQLTHTTCGHELKPVLSCHRCAAPIAREDIRLD